MCPKGEKTGGRENGVWSTLRLLSHNGITHKLSERAWKQLCRQFDTRKAQLNQFGYVSIAVNSICVDRGHKCMRCALRDPNKKVNSCTYLVRKIVGEDIFAHLYLNDFGVWWDLKSDVDVRQALQKVSDVLSSATKI